jgi:SH3 domain protein
MFMAWKSAGCVVIAVCLLGVAGGAWSQPVYVSDVIRVSVRSGPGSEHKSLAVTESGQLLELLKPGDEWSLVRLPNGTEGYILSRFLTEAQPGRHQLVRLEEKIKALTAQAAALAEEHNRVKAEKETLAAAAADGQLAFDRLRAEFERFRSDTADAAGLKAKADALAEELEQKTRQIAELSARADELFPVTTLYWFLAGAGVLLVGFLTGYSVKRQRRWSSLS